MAVSKDKLPSLRELLHGSPNTQAPYLPPIQASQSPTSMVNADDQVKHRSIFTTYNILEIIAEFNEQVYVFSKTKTVFGRINVQRK